MLSHEQGEKISKKLTHLVKRGHEKKIVITDRDNNPLLRFPLTFFIVITLIMPLLVGVVIFLFLMSEHHAIIEDA